MLLRAAIGGAGIIHGGLYLMDNGPAGFRAWLLGVASIAGGVSLLAGFLTPIAGGLVGLAALDLGAIWFPLLAANQMEARLLSIFVVLVAIAVILLGPGALSVDARLFGRREIIIPRTPRSLKS